MTTEYTGYLILEVIGDLPYGGSVTLGVDKPEVAK